MSLLHPVGDTARKLGESLQSMELGDADQILVDTVMSLAVEVDTAASASLKVRYYRYYMDAVRDLKRCSDANRDRRLAEEARQAEELARRVAQRGNRLEKLRGARDDGDREKWDRAQAAKIRRLQRKGLSIAEVAAQLKWDPSAVRAQLAAFPAPARRGA